MKSITNSKTSEQTYKSLSFLSIVCCILFTNYLFVNSENAYARAVKIIPIKDPATENRVLSLYRRASSEFKNGKKVSARKLLVEATKYDRTGMSPYVHALLSQIYYELANPNSAVTHALISLKYNPKQKKLIHNLALYAKEANQYGKAIAYLEISRKKSGSKEKKEIDSLITLLKEQQKSASQFSLDNEDYLDKLTYEDSVNKWPKAKFPLKVYIQPTSSVKGFKMNFPKLAKESFIAWYKASGKKLPFEFIDNVDSANIKLTWTDKRLRTTDDKRERMKAGLTSSRITISGVIKDSHIQIRTLNPFSKKGIENDKIKSTCLHEIGHALGLSGHSSNHSDIMYMGVAKRQLPALTKRDKKTIQKLYSAYKEIAMKGVPDKPVITQTADRTKQVGQTITGKTPSLQRNVPSPNFPNNLYNRQYNPAQNVAKIPGNQYQQVPMQQYVQRPYQPRAQQPYPQPQQYPLANPQMVPGWQTVPYYNAPRPVPTQYIAVPVPTQYQYIPQPQYAPGTVYQAPPNMYSYTPPSIPLRPATPYPTPNSYQNPYPPTPQKPVQQNQFQMIDNIFQNFKPKLQQFMNSGSQPLNPGQNPYQ